MSAPKNLSNQKLKNHKSESSPLFESGFLFVNRYLILKKIGQGAHAEVYEAQDLLANKNLVALKIIKLLEEDSERQKKHLNMEKEAFAKLIFNQNVIGLRDFDNSQKLFYMVIDLATGAKNFQNKFRVFGNLLTLEEIIYYFSQIAKGMIGVHEAGIVHRDLKPQNILLTQEEIVKISDFGISRLQIKKQNDQDWPSGFEGTPKYSAPEQYINGQDCYFTSDLYSVGIMLYELATGVAPFAIFKDFKNDKERYTYILNQHLKEPILRPKIFNPNLPQSLDNLIMKCVAKDWRYRYQSFNDFLKDLEDLKNKNEAKIEEIPQTWGRGKNERFLKKAKNSRYQRFFKIFDWKNLMIFFGLLSIFIFGMLLSILLT